MTGNEHNGIVLGLVASLDDPDGLGRVQVDFCGTGERSAWARLASPMAGKGRGFFFRPEAGDEVLVAFEHGDPRRPYVLGALWSRADAPPPDDGDRTANNWRFIRSRSGHLIKLDDTPGAERIEVQDKDGNCRVVLDPVGKKVEVRCSTGDVSVATGSGAVTIEATTVEVRSKGAMTIQADGVLTLKGQTVNIN